MTFDHTAYRMNNRAKIYGQTRQWKQTNKSRDVELNKQERARLRSEVLLHYCGKTMRFGDLVVNVVSYAMRCGSCGFSDHRALQLDHVDNNGAQERKAIGNRLSAGTTFYRWLRRNGLPPGYQVLCANCNWIKEIDRRGTYAT